MKRKGQMRVMQQIDIFSLTDDDLYYGEFKQAADKVKPSFEQGEFVRVHDPEDIKDNIEYTEDFYYLKGFAKRRGFIDLVEIIANQKVVYQVTFTDKKESETGMFYEGDLYLV